MSAMLKLAHTPIQLGTFFHRGSEYIYKLVITNYHTGYKCIGTVYDSTGKHTLSMVEREYQYLHITQYDLGHDMLDLLNQAAPTNMKGI